MGEKATIGVLITILTITIISGETGMKKNVAFTLTSGFFNAPYIGYRTVVTNVGADIIQDLGTFKTTASGVYYFAFTALSEKNKSLKVSLRKNRRPIVTGFADDVGFKSFTLTAILDLKPGDVVYVFVEDGAIYESSVAYRSFTSFSGYKLFDTAPESTGFFSSLLGRALDDIAKDGEGRGGGLLNTNNVTLEMTGETNFTQHYAREDDEDRIFERLNEIDAKR